MSAAARPHELSSCIHCSAPVHNNKSVTDWWALSISLSWQQLQITVDQVFEIELRGFLGTAPAAHRVVRGLGPVDHIFGLSWWVWTQTRRAWVLFQSTRTWMRCGRNLPSHAWTMSKALRPNDELLLLAVAFNPTTTRHGEVFLLPSKHTNNYSVSSHLGMMQPKMDKSAQV